MATRTTPDVGGMGHSVKRKEDPRFLQGKGNYVDDVVLPGMLYLDIVRSPFAHAKIKKIDASKATAIPGVLAVITGETLAKYNLHWMPTLMSDTQMVLPVEKVMYQAQEVAAVLATSRYAAADGVAAVEVEYEPLPGGVDPRKAYDAVVGGAASRAVWGLDFANVQGLQQRKVHAACHRKDCRPAGWLERPDGRLPLGGTGIRSGRFPLPLSCLPRAQTLLVAPRLVGQSGLAVFAPKPIARVTIALQRVRMI